MFLTSFFDQILETGSFIEVEFRDKRCLSEFFGAFKQAITVTKQGGCNLGYNFRVKGYNLSDVLIYLPINPKCNITLCNKFTFSISSLARLSRLSQRLLKQGGCNLESN